MDNHATVYCAHVCIILVTMFGHAKVVLHEDFMYHNNDVRNMSATKLDITEDH